LDFGSFDITTETALTFRIYGGDGIGSAGSGNWRIDDVSLTASTIPEPSTYGFIGGAGALGVATFRRFRSRRNVEPSEHDIAG
jgi:hypothetical protein